MIYRNFGTMGWKVSSVGMGTWNIGNQWGDVSDDEAFSVIRNGFEAGINIFDTSDSYGIPYGLSEKRLGVALQGIRNRSYIVSKVGLWGSRTGLKIPMETTDMVRLCVHACLYRLRTDWVDVMLCHEPNIEDPSVYLEAFEMLKQSGEIREYGISTNSLDVIKRFNAAGNCRVVETDYSVINKSPENDILPYCKEHGIAVMLRGPLAQGLLSGKYDENTVFDDKVRKSWNVGGRNREFYVESLKKVEALREICGDGDIAQMAVRYVISHDCEPVAIPGAKTPEQAINNAKTGSQLLDSETYEKIKRL